ncbi:MAG: metal-dependent hydrolase [Desulfobacterales bacterium]|jgi:inner membrane protein
MDTITQIALGAAVGEVTLGREVGKRAILWGGLCGLFPDLDVLVPLGDAVKDFTYHRSASHSLFVLALLTPVFVWLILKIHPQTRIHLKKWVLLVYLAFATHVILDCCTVYGTQIFWPLPTPPVMWSTIFIIDPLYSMPLIVGVLVALIFSRKTRRGHIINAACLSLSTLYLLWCVGVKWHVENVVHASLRQQNITQQSVLTIPSPFNTLLWRILVMDDMDDKGYYEGYYSIFDKTDSIRIRQYPTDTGLLQGLEHHWPVKRLQWFTHGFYSVRQKENDIVIADLRMGSEPYYVFQFKVGEFANPHPIPTKSERVRVEMGWNQLQKVWERIWRDLAI